jgi:hypothetical protein
MLAPLNSLPLRAKHFHDIKLLILLNAAIPVTGRGGPLGCEVSRLPHFLDSCLTDGG